MLGHGPVGDLVDGGHVTAEGLAREELRTHRATDLRTLRNLALAGFEVADVEVPLAVGAIGASQPVVVELGL